MKHMLKPIIAIMMIMTLLIGTALAYEDGSVYDSYIDPGAYYTENEGIVFAVSGKSYIRSTPDLGGAVVGTLPEHQEATYLGDVESDYRGVEWYKINYEDTSGWVSSKYTYLSIIQIEPYYFYNRLLASERSFIRTAPSTDAHDLGSIPKGQSGKYQGRFTADMNGRIWYYISYNGITGWVSSRYVDFDRS